MGLLTPEKPAGLLAQSGTPTVPSLSNPSFGISQSTPQVLAPGSPSTADVLKTLFVNENQVRPAFAKSNETIPFKGGLLNSIAYNTVERLKEIIPKAATILASNLPFNGGKVNLPFDQSRLGFSGTGSTVQSTGERTVQHFENLQDTNNPDNSTLKTVGNALIAGFSTPISDFFDQLVASDVIKAGANAGLEITRYNPEVNKAFQQLGLNPKNFSPDAINTVFTHRLSNIIEKYGGVADINEPLTVGGKFTMTGHYGNLPPEAINELNQLGDAMNTIAKQYNGTGIPNLNNFGKLLQDTSRIFTDDLSHFLENPQYDLFGRPIKLGSETLPGYRDVPGQPPAFGMSTKKVEPVGFAKDKNDVPITSPFGDKLPLNPDGTITVYHRTTPEIAQKIIENGLLGSTVQGEEGKVYVSTNELGGQNIGKEKTEVLKFNIDPKITNIDNSYRNGTHDLVVNATDLQGIKPVIEQKISPEDIINKIAQSNDSQRIATLLDSTGVDKSQIPQMSRVLSKIDNPKRVRNIIEGFDVTRTPKQLPPQLEAKQIAIDVKKQALEATQLQPLEKYVVKSGNMKGSLPELGVGTSKFAKQGDTIIDNTVGHGKYAEDIRTQFEDKYLPAKAEIKKLETELKQEVKNLKYSSEGIPLALNARQKALLNSGDFSKSTQSIDQIQGEQGEVKSIEIQAKQADSILHGEEIPHGVSLPEIIANTVTPVNARVHLIDTYLRTPNRVMEKIGFGKEAKELRTAMDGYWKELPKNINKIGDWAKEVPKESNQRIFKFLDGQAITLQPEEQKVASEIRTWLKEWADRLNLGTDNRISDYITHVFDKDFTDKGFPEEIAKIIADKVPGSVYDPFTLRRLGAKGYLEDTWKALDAYVKRGTRKAWLDPVLESIQLKAGSSLELSNIEKSQWQYIKKYVDNINMRPSDLDESIDNVVRSMFGNKFGQRPVTSITRMLRKATFRGMLGLNFSSAMRNISQGINTYAILGEKYTAVGYASLLKQGAMSELEREGVLNAGFIQDKTLSAVGTAIQKIDKGLFILFDTAEKINRGSAYFGAKAQGIARGYSEEKAIEYAKFIVRKTQFVFDSVDTPVGMQGDIMKTLFQFQSFTTKQIEFLTEMAKNKNYLGLLRYAIGGLIFAYTIGKAFGMDKKELLPWYRFETPASLKFPVEVVKAGVNTPNQYGQQRSLSQKFKDVFNSAIGLVPAGSQIKKTVQGYNAIKQGKSTDAAGRAQFSVGGTVAKDAQALLFGKYASQNAKDYFAGDTYAEQKYNELLKSKTAKADFEKIIKDDPNLAKNILRIKEKIDLGITPDDDKILAMGVQNKERAKYIAGQFNKLKTKEEKAKLFQEYVTKKIITKEISAQLKEFLK